MEKYLDPKNDLVFKKVFGEHPDLLTSFLNALMPFEQGRYIIDLEYLPSEQAPELPDILKYTIVDVRCKDNQGRQFIIEMQMFWDDSFTSRMLFNASKAYVRQLRKGEQYKYLQPVYSLAIVNDKFDKHTTTFYHDYKMVNIVDTNQQIEGLELIFVELPKFRPETVTDRKMMVLWLRFLSEVETMMPVPEDLKNDPEIAKALEICRESAFTLEEIEAYDKRWDEISAYRSMMDNAEKKGMEKGMEKGRLEGAINSKREIAKSLKIQGVPIDVIIKASGLSKAEIDAL